MPVQLTMQSLPPELVNHVFSFITPAHLTILSRTSSACCNAAERILYGHLSLSPSTRDLSGVFNTLAFNPHIASYVRSFRFTVDLYTFDDRHYNLKTLQVAQALSNMSELTSLNIFVDHAASWVLSNDTTYNIFWEPS